MYWKKDKRIFISACDRYSARYLGSDVGSVSEYSCNGKWYFAASVNGKRYNSLWKELPIEPTYPSLGEAKAALAAYVASAMCPPNTEKQKKEVGK
jgi:hypothetical protein